MTVHCALGKSLGLRRYFIIYPSSRHNTVTSQTKIIVSRCPTNYICLGNFLFSSEQLALLDFLVAHCIFPKHLSFARFTSVLRPFTPKAETWSRVHMGVWDEVRGVFRGARECPSCFLAVFVAGIFRQNSSRLVGKPGGVNFILIVVVWNLGWAHGWVVEKPGGGKFQFNCCGLKNEVGSKFKFVNFLWGGWKNKVGSI